MSDLSINDMFQESFGQSIARGLEDLAVNIRAQAAAIERQGFAALERAEYASASWTYLDEFGYKVIGELDQIQTQVHLDSQMQARVEAAKLALGQADSFLTAAKQTANLAENIAAVGKNVGGLISALELIGQIRSPESKAFEVGGELSKIVGSIVGGAVAVAAGWGLFAGVGMALGVGFISYIFWEKFVAPHIGWSLDKSPLFWDAFFEGISRAVNSLFLQAIPQTFIEPLVLDLDGDGIETNGITAEKQVLFDHNGDGIRAGTGWIKGDDAIVVLDRNGNGSIDNGGELFGVDTVLSNGQKATTGFKALADLDTNRDGIFNNADSRYAQVQIWRDLDQDGVSDKGELQFLAEAGIASISLNSVANTRNFGNGNVQTDTANFTRTDGSTGTASNLNFANNPFYREFVDSVALTTEAARLTNLRGSGMVRDLREAASINAALIEDINELVGPSRGEMMRQLDPLLQDWAATANFKTSQQRAAEMGVMLLFGLPEVTAAEMKAIRLIAQPGSNSTQILIALGVTAERYNVVREKITEVGKMIGVLEAFNGQTFLDFSGTGGNQTSFPALLASATSADGNNATAATLAISSVVVVSPLWPGQVELLRRSYAVLKESVYGDLVGQTRLKSYLDAVSLSVSTNGISMDFTSLYEKLDSAYKNDPMGTFIDCLDLQKYIDPLCKMGWQGAAKLAAWVSDIASKGQLDQLKSSLEIAYAESSNGVPEIKVGTTSSETISAGKADDIVIGLSGNDSLYGNAGNDILDGGQGNDSLLGGEGNDVYLFSRGSGQDTVYNRDTAAGKIDAIQFAADIASTDVKISRAQDDLVLSIAGTSDKLTINSYFQNDGSNTYRVEEIRFADGTLWNVQTVKAIALQSTSGNDTLHGYATADTINGGDGNDWLLGEAGDDVLNGDSGNDYLAGSNGNDIINGGAGVDSLFGDNGNDILDGGIGDDNLYGNAGTDILQGGAGNDYLSDSSGAALFDGGSGNDTIYGGAHAEIFIGGQGNDTYTTGAGNDIVLFNKGDGQDVFAAGGAGNDTVSLGGSSLRYEDLSLAKSATDLVLKVGATDQITFRNWYATTPTRPVATLQVIAEAMEDFDPGGSDPLQDQQVERFNFTGLVDSFDAARVTDSTLSSWALTNALTNFQLDSSDTSAMGGDFAYQYGKNGTLGGMGVTSALNALSDVNLGAAPQALAAWSEPQSGTIRLS